MIDEIIYLYQYLIFVYVLLLVGFYLTLAVLGYIHIQRKKYNYSRKEETQLLNNPEIVPGISIIAPAYNEEVIVIDSTNSLLNLDYPNFEVVVVNDGSKDNTLELLISHFELEEFSDVYIQKVLCRPVKRIFKSRNPKYSNLTIIDKVNGGTKADAMNAGVNYIKNNYFINTDIDCILSRDTLKKVILPVLDSDIPVIAVGATMRMANGCDIRDGVMEQARPPKDFIPCFQETEYLRSYIVAKMGWAAINAIPNVSGGFGLFKTSIVVDVGGFDSASHAEDMDITIRMGAYMRENKKKYKIEQIPDTCCWTEGPPNFSVLHRQRTRWARGLLQIFVVHRRIVFNMRYGRLGLLILPYALIFEFLAPFIEFGGFIFLIYSFITNSINFETFWLMLGFVYASGVTVSMITISYDISVKKIYKNFWDYLRLILFFSIEPILYHPLIVFFSIKGYWQYLTKKNFQWGTMTRAGFKSGASKEEATILKTENDIKDFNSTE